MDQYLYETATAYGYTKEVGVYALASVCNGLLAKGGICKRAGVAILYPPKTDKRGLYRMEKELKKMCAERDIEFEGCEYICNPLLLVPGVQVTGGAVHTMLWCANATKKMDIVQCGWIGMAGMLRIADEKQEELSKCFAATFMEKIYSYKTRLFTEWKIEAAHAGGVSVIRQVTEGGIFAAFYELAKEENVGLNIDMKKILVLQETIEVCEHFRLNPYQMTSVGTFLMLTEEGEVLADALNRMGFAAAVIGHTTENAEKIMHNGEDIRYIDRPASDEIYKIFQEDL